MNFLCQEAETENEKVIIFKYLWLVYLISFSGILLILNENLRNLGYFLFIVSIIMFIPIRNKITKAMKEGCHIKGSKWSIKNPIEIRIKK